jgi:hypothetical protein
MSGDMEMPRTQNKSNVRGSLVKADVKVNFSKATLFEEVLRWRWKEIVAAEKAHRYPTSVRHSEDFAAICAG